MSRSALSETPVVDEVTSSPVSIVINRDFALLWSGQAISILGDLIFTTTITIWVGLVLARGQNWGALAVSGTLIASAPQFCRSEEHTSELQSPDHLVDLLLLVTTHLPPPPHT